MGLIPVQLCPYRKGKSGPRDGQHPGGVPCEGEAGTGVILNKPANAKGASKPPVRGSAQILPHRPHKEAALRAPDLRFLVPGQHIPTASTAQASVGCYGNPRKLT